jgi:Ca2+-binding RTX toxin-like protein
LLWNPFLADQFGQPDQYISLLRGRVWEGEAAGTRLVNIENITAGSGDDRLTGDHGANRLDGWNGNDTLMGNGGDDLLYGGLGDDLALYGFDQDQYAITTRENGVTEVAYIGASTGDGTDLLVSIETLRFADGDLVL